jgi:hypothetical protein
MCVVCGCGGGPAAAGGAALAAGGAAAPATLGTPDAPDAPAMQVDARGDLHFGAGVARVSVPGLRG